MKQVLTCLVGCSLIVALSSCRNDNGKTWTVSQNLKISGKALLPDAATEATYQLNYIDQNSLRNLAEGSSFDSETSRFNLTINDTMFTDLGVLSSADSITANGQDVELIADFSDAGFSSKPLYQLRLELRPEELSGTQNIYYYQWLTPVDRGDIYSSDNKNLALDTIELVEVGSAEVKITDTAGNAIENASAFAILRAEVESGTADNAEAWLTPIYRPVISKTNSEGMTHVLPLNAAEGNKDFQIVAFAEGFCLFVSDLITYSEDLTTAEINLSECQEESSDIKISTSFPNDVKIFEESDEDSNIYEVAYTNDKSMFIRVDSYSKDIRPLEIRVYDGHNSEDENLLLKQTTEYFKSQVEIELPNIFPSQNSTDGSFLISVTPVLNNKDLESQENQEALQLLGRKKLTAPDIDFMEQLQLKSSADVNNIVSGLTGNSFSVSQSKCLDGEAIGISVASEDAVFSECKDQVASFNVDDFSFAASSGEGEEKSFTFYFRDRFGNVSDDDPANRNIVDVQIDYGLPTISDSDVYLKFGIANSSDAAGTDANRYIFPEGAYVDMDEDETDTLIITPSTISNFVFRFASPSQCSYDATAADGIYSGSNGAKLVGFKLAANSAALSETEQIECLADEASETRDLTLSSSLVSFPTNSSSDASFVVKVIDYAGHQSQDLTVSIPACHSNAESVESDPKKPVCWRPQALVDMS